MSSKKIWLSFNPRWLIFLNVFAFFSLEVHAASYAKIFKKVDPAVVVIHTRAQAQVIVEKRGSTRLAQPSAGLGSGVVISKDGLVMTAAHVVQVSDKVAVEFVDGKKYPARVVSTSALTDIALIKLEKLPNEMSVAKLGDSDKAAIGENVFVIGAPYGIDHTLTVGHLSGKRKESLLDPRYGLVEFLQTDAAINKGNSGGPLFNVKGEVIGIVSHIKSASGGSEGLGFATSINVARRVLLEEKSVWLGLEILPVDRELAEALNIPTGRMLVQRVARNSLGGFLGLRGGTIPAVINGRKLLLGGDVVLSINGINLDVLKARDELINLPYGSRIDVIVLRQGVEKSLFTSKQQRR